MRRLALLLAALAPGVVTAAAGPHAWAEVGLREPGRAYAAVDTPSASTRLEGGRAIPPGGRLRSEGFRLEPGEYRLRLLVQGDTRVADADLAVEIEGGGGAPRRWDRPMTSPPELRVDRSRAYTVTVRNRSVRSIGIGPLAFLRRVARAPVQIVLCVPDAYAPFPEAHPEALYGRLRAAGTYHAGFRAAGDNTIAFTRTLFRRTIPSGDVMGRALRGHGLLTATISDNFYVMADVEEHDFESAVVVRDTLTSDAEIADRAAEWLRRRDGEDFFLYVHFLADHDVVGLSHRPPSDGLLGAAVDAIRAAAPQAIIVVAPDHGPMDRHAWDERGQLSGGQGWGLYSDTQHIPLVALGPGIRRDAACGRRWSWADLRDLLASARPGATRELVAALDCRGPDRDRIIVEGWKQQLAISDRAFHYVSYDPTVPYPMFVARTGRLVRDRFLDQEALFDARADPEQEVDVGASHVAELLRYRLAAAEERRARFGREPAAGGVLRLLYLSKRCQPPPAVRLRSDEPLALEGGSGPAVEARAAGGAVVLRWGQPSCFRDLRVRATALNALEIELPGGDLYLGGGLLHRRERARLDGANGLGLLRADPSRGVDDVFVRNGAREGLYVFLEDLPAAAPASGDPARRSAAPRGTNASVEEVRRMMRSWGYMREADADP